MGLTTKQKQFIEAYLLTKNATQSALTAGYPKASAHSVGSENLTKPEIAKAIADGLARQLEASRAKAAKTGLTKERWLQEIRRIAFANMDDFATVNTIKDRKWEGSDETGDFVDCETQSVTLTSTEVRQLKKKGLGSAIKKLTESQTQHGGSLGIELHNKLPALELLGKAYGWVKDQMEVSGPDGGPQVIVSLPGNGFEFESQEKKKE